MSKVITVLIILAIILIAVCILFLFPKTETDTSGDHNNYKTSNTNMTITSPSFNDNDYIPAKFTCDGSTSLTAGGGINPELDISGVPTAAKSLALVMHDPDAPMAGGFTHWLIWNVDPKTPVIKEGNLPVGSIEGKNSSGATSYVGPCPPSGVHHYHFTIYALSDIIDLRSGSDKKSLESEINKYLLARADLVGLYQRK